MYIQLFQTFLLVAKLGSITQTAEQLNFTQPAVSAQINTLEKHFNVLLFERVRKKLYITEAGRDMVGYAEKMLDLYNQIQETMNSHAIDSNRIIIASSTQLINYLLPDILRNFHENNLNHYVSVEVCRNTKAVEKGLLDNTFDIGIVHDQIASDQLKYIEILQAELIWVGHNELIKNNLTDHFTDYPIIQFRFGSDMRRKVEEAIKGHKYKQMVEYSDAEAILRAVADKLGVALLPQIMVQSFLDQGIFVKLIHDESIKCPISIVIHKNKNITTSLKAFLNSAFLYAQKEQLLNQLL
jgi:DNA-binding transcriptional LysR family regulator